MLRPSLTSLTALCLAACANLSDGARLQGVVAVGRPLPHAQVVVRDAKGNTVTTHTDATGHYSVEVSMLTAPLVLWASEASNPNCRSNQLPRAFCVTALLASLRPGDNTANLNPLTDLITSDVATEIGRAPWRARA